MQIKENIGIFSFLYIFYYLNFKYTLIIYNPKDSIFTALQPRVYKIQAGVGRNT
ncbi:hypothetical protein ANASTE_02046 [Anaerofustis stercorihominis DSM 17244]|uniref:Uncharacterized protein n=1 Tax=Anaerofustis stercorihominis DSM 17244 TaxID=445971 RepID=B1CA12_9FIRM|nr:hypothetical protein ANASTE_02046 [Anaerofustis stercorihominis DSM 17244]